MNARVREARIKKLIKHLRSVPNRGFDMRMWVRGSERNGAVWYRKRNAEKLLAKAHKNKYECGMAACVGGHAVTVFPKILDFKNGTVHLKKKLGTYEYYGFGAIAEALGLRRTDANRLCAAEARHRTPKAAAQFLSKLLKLYKKNPGREREFGIPF